ncbi:MAG: signal peptidase I [Clostridiales bacterium]|nr:signal peptidase I [Clostridiales bacterium]
MTRGADKYKEQKTTESVQKNIQDGKKKKKPVFIKDLFDLLIKIGLIVLAFYLMGTYLFGVHRVSLPNMEPNVKDGDLVFFYRLDKEFVAGDIAVMQREGKLDIQRVIAIGGDTVDIDEENLRVNGYVQHSLENVYTSGKTMRYAEGIDFPVTLAENEIFLLGDKREDATDSRIYGPVKKEDTLGKIMLVLRRRGF